MSKKELNQRMVKDLISFSNLNGISAHEEKIAEAIKKSLNNLPNLIFERDGLGSLAVIKKTNPNAPTISFTCHMDEVGFMVTKIDKYGFIKFSPIGGWWGHVVLGQVLTITTSDGKEIKGVVGSTPPHLLSNEKMKTVIKISDMFLDIGASKKEEVLKIGINIGDQITPCVTPWQTVNKDRIFAKAHDNRASVVAGIEVMKALENIDHESNVIFVASVQEEVGLRGAKTSSFKWTPDVAFAIDVTIAHDTPGVKDRSSEINTGAALSMFDSYIIANPKLFKMVEKIAKKYKIDYTYDSLVAGGTDAGEIHMAKDGVITMTLSIPSRYMHSHYSMVSAHDVQAVVDVIVNFIKDFNQEKLSSLKFK